MRWVRTGDDHGIDIGAPDRRQRIGCHIDGPCFIGDGPRPRNRGVTHHLHRRTGQIVGKNPGMIRPHDPRADDG